jgi:hypothetical protein
MVNQKMKTNGISTNSGYESQLWQMIDTPFDKTSFGKCK